ncbi:MAG TPA: sigma 54-interacting transcriptional regulator [Pyrinomonadaceae bacterium]|nr:sigma 54-interacting transcriptional regulator [Pyrinomonadaceae bacterium]
MNNENFSNQQKLLTILSEVGSALNTSQSLRSNLTAATDILLKMLGLTSCFVVLYEAETDKLIPYSTSGLSATEFRKLDVKADKTILRQVFTTCKLIIIEQKNIETSLDFLNREAEQSLVLIPIILKTQCLGVVAAEFVFQAKTDYDKIVAFFEVVASMIAQALKVEQYLAEEREKLVEENSHLRQELREKYDFSHIIGNSSKMKQVYDQVSQVARTNTTVLLRGESGTGKEMIANAIHYNSLRTKRPFIKVNCAALPETLIESELFGHEKGAFTGASLRKKGRFELANDGTLFLDEIGDLPIQTQIKLLRVLQEREFERVGGTETIKVNVRLITATNSHLEEAITEGKFREDLFYRLNVFQIFLPPLRERKSDILMLAEHFVEKFEREHGKRIRRISTPAIDMLTAYHYPGNVRELENAIERAVVACDENVIHGHHLPPTLQTAEVSNTVTKVTLESSVAAFEKDLIQDTLKTTKGNCAKAANLLNTTERIINYKIKKYNINPKRFRS